MTAKKHIIQKIKCFDIKDYNRIRALEKQRCCFNLKSLDLVKSSECMKMYMRGTMVEVLVGPFYTKIDYLTSGRGQLTAPPHMLETVEIDRKRYTYLPYDSKEYLALAALLDYSNT